MSLVLGSWGHLFSKCVFLAFLGFVGNFSSLPGCQWRCECLERQILTEFFGKAGFSSLWLLVFSWSPTSFASLVEFGGYPGSFHALPSMDLPCNPWLSGPPSPIPCGFFPNSSLQRQLVLEASLAPSSIPDSPRRLQGEGYIWTSLPRAGGAGSDLGLCAPAFITSGSVYLPGAACSQNLGGPGSSTARILEALSFSHQHWGCWCQCNVGTLLFLG